MTDHWQDSALCAQTDPRLWFLESGGSAVLARRVCGRCPVKAECLADVMAYEAEHGWGPGIYAGLTPRQRSAMRRRAA